MATTRDGIEVNIPPKEACPAAYAMAGAINAFYGSLTMHDGQLRADITRNFADALAHGLFGPHTPPQLLTAFLGLDKTTEADR